MAKIIDSSFKNWNDGETITAADYKMEHDIIKMAVNDNDDRIAILENAAGGAIKRVPNGPSFPPNPEPGDIFYRTDQYILYVLGPDKQWEPQNIKNLLSAHTSNVENPHATTAAQVGAYSKNESNERYYTKTESDTTFTRKSDTGAVSGSGAGFSLAAGFQILPLVQYIKEINTNIFEQKASGTDIYFKKPGLYLVNFSLTRSDLLAGHYWEIGYAINNNQGSLVTQKIRAGRNDWAALSGPNETNVPLSITHPVRVKANDFINFNSNSQDGPRSYEYIKFSVVRISD